MKTNRKRCLCDLCTHISPKIDRIRKALPKILQKDFDDLMMRMMVAEEDRDVADSKLRGEWPNWEWIKSAREKAERES